MRIWPIGRPITDSLIYEVDPLKMAADIEAMAQRQLQEIRDDRAQLKKSEDLKAFGDTVQSDHAVSGETESGAKRAGAQARKPAENRGKQQ